MIGSALGLVAAYYGRWFDPVLQRVNEVILAFPVVLFAMAVLVAVGPSLLNLTLVIAFVNIPIYFRIIRSVVLPMRHAEFVDAARASGNSVRHPRTAPPAEPVGADHRSAHRQFRLGDSDPRRAELPRSWRPSSGAGMGADGPAGLQLRDLRTVVDRVLPGVGDLHRGADLDQGRRVCRAGGAHQVSPLLEIAGLEVDLGEDARPTHVLRGVRLEVEAGEVVGLVGESGSGKTTMMLAVAGLLPRSAQIRAGSIALSGRDLLALTGRAWRTVRGREMACVFQNARNALHPMMTIGSQIARMHKLHQGSSNEQAWTETIALLDRVGLSDADQLARRSRTSSPEASVSEQ